MRRFTYASPRSLVDTIALLTEPAGGTRPLAGGTDLLPLMKDDLLAPAQLVDIKRLTDLDDQIVDEPDGVTIGALATLAQIEEDPLIVARYPVLAESAGLAASPQLRNMATIGGNLLQRPRCWYFRDPRVHCWLKGGEECTARGGENRLHALFQVSRCAAVHPSDPATALLALDAEVHLRGRDGERKLSLADFFAPPTEERRTETVIADDELIVAIRIPPHSASARSAYRKAMDRKVWAFALVGVAAVLELEANRVTRARLSLAGVAPIPWRAEAAERVLTGADVSDALIVETAQAALADAEPLERNSYKIPLAQALVRQTLRALIER
jgi:xanthine dehydrogenase YagS FAD-binding subunit